MCFLHIVVIGVTGMTGSHVAVELLNRGHRVTGISRNPQKLGHHERYETRSIDLSTAPISDIMQAIQLADVVVNAYGPHTQMGEALTYKSYVEITREIVIAAKAAQSPYLIMIGGAGVLLMPDKPFVTATDDPRFYDAFIRGQIDSEAYVAHCKEWAGDEANMLEEARRAWLLEQSGDGSAQTRAVLAAADRIFDMKGPVVSFHTGGRATATFFDGNTSFKWTYMSTPPLYRPGKRTNSYEGSFDVLPLKSSKRTAASPGTDDLSIFEGRLHGIALADMALAVAEEAEGQEKIWKHWCPFVPDLDDTIGPVYVKIGHSFQ